MKTNYLLTGNLIRSLLIGGLWLTVGNMWGLSSSYYATLEVKVANSVGVGKVYVNSDNQTAAKMSHADTQSTTSENGSKEMKAYAYPQTGYELYKWEFVSAARYTKSKNTNHTAADITTTTSPLSVTMCTPSGSKDNSEKASLLVIRAIFWRPNGANISKLTFRTTEHGKYSVKSIAKDGVTQTTFNYSNISTTAKEVSNVVAGMPIDCSATPDNGYIFYSYYTLDAYGNKAYIGDLFNPTQVLLLDDDVAALGAEFTDNSYCVGKTLLPTLSDALQFVNTSDVKTIQVVKDNTVEAGYYTIPAGVTLLIPVDATQTTPTTVVERVNENSTKPSSAYRTLTLAGGVHLDVFGAIEVGGRQNSYNNNGTGRPQGKTYGHLIMNSGSDITIESGANLYAWGFITGAGEKDEDGRYKCAIDIRRGGTVREMFQVYDWEGGSEALDMYGNAYDVFMINEYFIQNVEIPTIYRPGSALYGYTGLKGIEIDDIKLIGTEGDEAAMFLMDNGADSEDTWVRKWYNPATDQQVYEINNAAKLGNLHITYNGYVFASEDYILPITNNMKIHVLSGEMEITQSTVLLAGAEIEVDKKATIVLKDDEQLFVFDYNEWDAHIHQNKYALRIEVRPGGVPTVRDISSAAGLGNAKINVHGTFVAAGTLYTTESGASIYSNDDDAGTIMFTNAVPATPTVDLYVHSYTANPKYYTRPIVPAILQNEDSNHPTTTTAGTPAGQSYCYMNGKWTMMTVDEDNSCFVYDNYGNYYAKPGEYVMINATKTEGTFSGNTDHTYSDAAGTGRLFILMDDCQWWEVKNIDNLYHCIHPQNDTYYSWNDTNKKWEEKKFAISWKDYDGSPILDAQGNPVVYYLPYGATPKYLSTNPTRPADVDYTYNFSGWSPTIGIVNGDQTYTAVYEKTAVKYEIVFKYEEGIKSGAIIKRQFLVRDAVPEPPTLYPIEGYESYEWTPAIGAVTGNQVYEAKWLELTPTTYAIAFQNYDGSILKKSDGETDAVYDVMANKRPVYDGTTPTKASTSEYTYSFKGWKALNGTVYANDALPIATCKTTYVAQFIQEEKTYSISFFKEDGTTQIGETQSLPLGADPVVPVYNKPADPQYSYKTQWKNMRTDAVVGVSVPSVSGAADYKADFIPTINRYTILANCEDEEGNALANCTFTGSGVYDYCATATHTLTAIPNEGYEFVKWQDEEGTVLATTANMSVAITANRTYTAVVRSAAMEVGLYESKTFSRPTTITDLVINASEEQSSDLNGLENLTITGHAYFDYYINAAAFTRQGQEWYAFGVPFPVVATDGIYKGATTTKLVLGTDIDIIYYDGAKRAQDGSENVNNWKYVEDLGNKTLQPGTLYMMAFARAYNGIVRFQMKADSQLDNSGSATVNEYTSDNAVDANWNGIANPALYKAYLNTGATIGQYRNSATGAWGTVDLTSVKFVVGRPVFVQVQNQQSVVVSRTAPSSAPLRRQAAALQSDRFDLQLLTPQGKTADRLFVIANDDAADTYTIGEDIAKAGVSTRVAQMWIDRYGARLCMNTIAATDNAALYPLTITAPAAGTYTLQAAPQNTEARLYLTYQGEVIADLTHQDFNLDLAKGTNSGYGLRLVTTRRDVVTDLDEVLGPNSTSDNEAGTEQTRKCIYRDQLYLIRGNQVFDAQGQRVQ